MAQAVPVKKVLCTLAAVVVVQAKLAQHLPTILVTQKVEMGLPQPFLAQALLMPVVVVGVAANPEP